MFLYKKKAQSWKLNPLLSKKWVYLTLFWLLCILPISYFYTEYSQKVIQRSESDILSWKVDWMQVPQSSADHLCVQVDGGSMQWILESGEYIWVRKIHDAPSEISRGDIVVVHQAGYTNNLIKEVRWVPGDILSIHDLETGWIPYNSWNTIEWSFFIKLNNTPVLLHDGALLVYQPGKKALFSLYSGKLWDKSYLIFGTQQWWSYDSSRYWPISWDAIIGKMEEHGKNDDFCKNKKLWIMDK